MEAKQFTEASPRTPDHKHVQKVNLNVVPKSL